MEAFRYISSGVDPINPSPTDPSTTDTFPVTADATTAPILTVPTSLAVNNLGFGVRDAGSGGSVGLLEKLLLVRRQSLKYAPKVRSPLGKNCQWADY